MKHRMPRKPRRLRWTSALLATLLVTSGLMAATTWAAPGPNDPGGSIDWLKQVPGGFEIVGGAADPNTTAPVSVLISVNGTRVATILADRAWHNGHGYIYRRAISEGTQTVCVDAVNVGLGANARIGCRNVTLNYSPRGALAVPKQTSGGFEVLGWAYDPDTANPVNVDIYLDGVKAGTVVANRPYYNGDGFAFAKAVPEGTHTICATAINLLHGSSKQIGCRTFTLRFSPVGALGVPTQTPGGFQVLGWAYDPETTNPVTVTFTVDGVAAGSAVANRPYYNGDGFAFAKSVAEGTHTICATAVNLLAGVNTSLGCRSIKLDFSPVGWIDRLTQVSGGVEVIGGALDPDTANDIYVDIQIDGTTVGRLYATGAWHGGHGFAGRYTASEGAHTVCAIGINVGAGASRQIACKQITLNFRPVGALESVVQARGGITVTGWAIDPDTASSINVQIYVDGVLIGTVPANIQRTDIGQRYPAHGANHGFRATLAYTKQGPHTVCARGVNVGPGGGPGELGCKSITLDFNPRGQYMTIARASATDSSIVVGGWAADPDTNEAIYVAVTMDGREIRRELADDYRADLATRMPGVGLYHGFAVKIPADGWKHHVCVHAINKYHGDANRLLGCKLIIAVDPDPPTAVRSVAVTPGYGQALVNWEPPTSDGGDPLITYTIVSKPGNITVRTTGRSATVGNLAAATTYYFTISASNTGGTSPAVNSAAVKTHTAPPPQTSPAPISTSRYIRNFTNTSNDLTWMRNAGATDASHNPSGHAYLILIHVGGQSSRNGVHGVVLSATSTWVSNAHMVSGIKAYMDGYASAQRPSAPLVLAVSTNNDIVVTSTMGAVWANEMIDPLVAYSGKFAGNIRVYGSNDMEPGFTGSVSASKAWLQGYLGATSTPFINGGSADGCSPSSPGGMCNNGWSMTDLHWLSKAAAPTRTSALPQIYNYTMPNQWKQISITGINAGRGAITFHGPLTEVTACQQAGSCGSLTGNQAWTALWNALRSDTRTYIGTLPISTDLRIN